MTRYEIGDRVRIPDGGQQPGGTFQGPAGHGLAWVIRDRDGAAVLIRLRDLDSCQEVTA
ncbi:hypothetical protein [Saccharopolyspora sp. NPDC003762]